MTNRDDRTDVESQRPDRAEAVEDQTAAQADPDDLGSTAPDSGLTAGGTGTGIDEDLIADTAGDGVDADAFTDEEALGMGMDDSSGYLDDTAEDTQG